MLAFATTAILAAISLLPPETGAALRADHDQILSAEAEELTNIARKLPPAVADAVKSLIPAPRASDGSTMFVPLPELVAKDEQAQPAAVKKIRDASAQAFLALAKRCLPPANTVPRLALADECLRACVARDPSNAEAWRLLGYVPHEQGWATPFAAAKLSEGFVLHPKFGWVEKAWVEHLDKGERPAPYVAGKSTKWLPAAEADELRKDFAKGWQIHTEHFTIRTNVPLDEAIGFGRRLEDLRQLFGAMMADVIGPDNGQTAQFAKNPKLVPAVLKKKHKVFYFASRDEYIAYLENSQGAGVRDNLGSYLSKKDTKGLGLTDGASFFFRDPGGQLDVTENLDHEVSHQLLFEMAGADRYDADKAHFWVFEGLGTYFETMRPQENGSIRIGGMIGKRIDIAQKRLVNDKEFIPIGRLTTYNRNLFYGGDGGDIYLNYAEAMALTVYFMQAHDEKYREAFLDYARDVYKGKMRGGTGKGLDDRLGVSFGDLARDFLAQLKAAKPLESVPQTEK